MPHLTQTLSSLAQVVLISTVPSGDNALMIAAAARHLPAPRCQAAMLWGDLVARAFQILFTLIVADVMRWPGVRFVGAILLDAS